MATAVSSQEDSMARIMLGGGSDFLKSKSGKGKERAKNPKDDVRGQDEDEQVVYKRNGGKGPGDESSDIVVGAELSHDDRDDDDKKGERRDCVTDVGEEQRAGEKEDGGAKAKDGKGLPGITDGILGGFGAGGEGNSKDVSTKADSDDENDEGVVNGSQGHLIP